MSSNRNPVKQFFITFPNSSGVVSRDTFLGHIWEERALCSYVVVEETHENGRPHLHANVKLKYAITKTKLLKKLEKDFPNDYRRIDVRITRETPKQALDGYLGKEINREDCFYKPDMDGKLGFYEWAWKKSQRLGAPNIHKIIQDHYNNLDSNYPEVSECARDSIKYWKNVWRREEKIAPENVIGELGRCQMIFYHLMKRTNGRWKHLYQG